MTLDVRDLVVAYDKKDVLHGVSLAVAEREVVALVGHNGAGKTTLMRATMGLVRWSAGSVEFQGAPVLPGRVATTVGRGLAFVPQGGNTFRSLKVRENLDIAIKAAAPDAAARLDDIYAMFPILRDRLEHPAGKLSGGQQQMVALALALVRGPRLVMLDEPSTGLAPVVVDEVFRRVVEMRDRLGISVLVVDQNVRRLLPIVDRVAVLKSGTIVFDGAPQTIESDEHLWRLF
jgi:branched-chain amino acid transport system ATP-binding protein